MKCPTDTTVDLLMTERNGVEIDYCPTCRGVWLDRGELDKIVDRAVDRDDDDDDDEHRRDARRGAIVPASYDKHRDHEPHRDERSGKRKKKSFLGDLFDF